MHAVGEVHDTPVRMSSLAESFGVGVGATHQVVPFQSSAKLSVPNQPTAAQNVAVGHDTPLSQLCEEK
jgi:hypothetical protein